MFMIATLTKKDGESMGFKNFIRSIFANKITGKEEAYYSNLEAAIYYKEFAIRSCISIIANALVLSEFKTYEKGKRVKKNNYYLFNIEPNQNQNATEFWHEVISKLVYDNECLIVQINNELLIADEFDVKNYAFYEDRYSNITIRGYNINNTFSESEVIYLKLNVEDIGNIINGLYEDYKKLLGNAMDGYKKSNGRKGILNIDGNYPQDKESQSRLEELMNVRFKKYFENDYAVLPLAKGLDYKESEQKSNIKSSRDVRAVIDDVIDFVCAAFHVPSGLVKGDVVGTSGITENFLNFCINPMAKLITSEINRKYYGRELFIQRTYVKVDTQNIHNLGIEKISKSADYYFKIRAKSINGILDMIGDDPIEAKWANEHYVTKNYQSVLNPNEKGGGKSGNGKKNS